MKTIVSTSTLALLFLSTQFAIAGTESFTGPSVGVDVNMQSMSTKVSGTLGGTATSGTFGESAIAGSVKAAYGFATSDKSVLSFGGTYSITDAKSGTVVAGANTVKFLGKNAWNVYLEPGFLAGANTLIYGKAGYASFKGETEGVATTPTTFHGYTYGIGIRSMIDNNLYVEIEGLQYKFSSKTFSGVTYEPSGTQANVGLGYKF